MAYDVLRAIMPIAGWPEEPFSTSFSRAAGGSLDFRDQRHVRTDANRRVHPPRRHAALSASVFTIAAARLSRPANLARPDF
jgi:hypothetical protein